MLGFSVNEIEEAFRRYDEVMSLICDNLMNEGETNKTKRKKNNATQKKYTQLTTPVLANTNKLRYDRIEYNDPYTIVFWNDGTKTMAIRQNEEYDEEKAIVLCYLKKLLGNDYVHTILEKIHNKEI